MAKRKEAEAFIIEYIEKLTPKSGNAEIYRERFDAMSDKEFDLFMKQLEEEEIKLAVITPNFSEHKLSVERNLALAKELGHEFFERIWINNADESPPYLSNVPYLVVDLPVRRQAQLLTKKIRIPDDNKSVDDLSGQPTGKSKGSKISYPELQIMTALNLDHAIIEMIKYRGGDEGGFNAMNKQISETGATSLNAISHLATGVVSTQTLKSFLFSMHIKNNAVEG